MGAQLPVAYSPYLQTAAGLISPLVDTTTGVAVSPAPQHTQNPGPPTQQQMVKRNEVSAKHLCSAVSIIINIVNP